MEKQESQAMSSGWIDQARQVVVQAETSVRSLLARAAEEGDYDALPPIAAIARALSLIGKDSNEEPDEVPQASEKAAYPKFSRTPHDRLRMVGWSDKKGSEYRHEAPREVLDLVVEVLEQTCGGEEPLPIDEILPNIVHPDTGREFPEYYTRTCLRWLQGLGLVKKHGHRGYAFTSRATDNPSKIIARHWQELTSGD